jgi:hypothetical protein
VVAATGVDHVDLGSAVPSHDLVAGDLVDDDRIAWRAARPRGR